MRHRFSRCFLFALGVLIWQGISAAHAAAQLITIRSDEDGLCLSLITAFDVRMRHCDGSDRQIWWLTPTAEGGTLSNSATGTCLDAGDPNQPLLNGQSVGVYPCHGGRQQKWFVYMLVDGQSSALVSSLNVNFGLKTTSNNDGRVELWKLSGTATPPPANMSWRFRTHTPAPLFPEQPQPPPRPAQPQPQPRPATASA